MKTQLILASTSPRRIELMKQVGLTFQVRSPDADETPARGESPRTLVIRLAREKAFSVGRKCKSSKTLIIAADTIVVASGGREILGKPKTQAEARRMLKKLSGKWHTVLTGYCILPLGIRGMSAPSVTRVISSSVKIRKLSNQEISGYVATGEPMDKAGSYAAQGIGMALVESIRGSYTNVVGLPMCQLLSDLKRSFGLSVLK